jgi:MATE family multidrug resistance protein
MLEVALNLWARGHAMRRWVEPEETKKVLRLAFPLILSNLTQPVLIATDTILAGHQHSAAVMGGMSVGGIFFSTIFWSFGFLRMATTGLVAQAYGARDGRAQSLHAARALLLALGFGTAILLMQQPLITLALHFLGGSAEVEAQALVYCHVLIWSAPAVLANYAVLGVLLGRQRARSALVLQAAMQVVNLSVAIWLVVARHWGIAGIATGTLAAEWAGAVVGLALIAHTLAERSLPWRAILHGPDLLHLFTLNRDIFLRTLCLVAAFAWFTRRGAASGDAVLAANAILLSFQTIAAYGLDGFANATEALTGAAIGAGDRARFVAVLRASTICAGLTAIAFTLFFSGAGGWMIALYSDQAAVRAEALRYLPWLAMLPIIAVWGYQCDGVFIGATRARDLRDSMMISLAGFLAGSIVLSRWWGNDGLWFSFLCFMALRGLTLAVRLPRLVRSLHDAPQQS